MVTYREAARDVAVIIVETDASDYESFCVDYAAACGLDAELLHDAVCSLMATLRSPDREAQHDHDNSALPVAAVAGA